MQEETSGLTKPIACASPLAEAASQPSGGVSEALERGEAPKTTSAIRLRQAALTRGKNLKSESSEFLDECRPSCRGKTK